MQRLNCIALIAAMGRLNSLPGLCTSNAFALKTQMKPHRSYLGCLDTEQLMNKASPDIEPLRDYLANDFKLKDSFLPGCLHYIVDTGCSISCSPDKRILNHLCLYQDLLKCLVSLESSPVSLVVLFACKLSRPMVKLGPSALLVIITLIKMCICLVPSITFH